jgi:hypothetical protein
MTSSLPPLAAPPVEPDGAEELLAAPPLVEPLLLPQPARATTIPMITPTRSVGFGLNMLSLSSAFCNLL